MKVLVTGRAIPLQPDRCTGQQLAEGFRQAGHECVFYGNFYGEPLRWLGSEEVTKIDFDLVVVTEMNDGMPGYESLFSHFRFNGVPKLYWDFDVSYHPDISYMWASRVKYDGYLVGNKYYLGKDGFGRFQKPVLHLPYACSPQIHRKMPDIRKNFILGFVGSMTAERVALIEMAKKNVINSAWVNATEGVYGDDLVRKTNEYCAMFHNNQGACKGLVPGRPWETTGCGTTLLMDRTSYRDFVDFIPTRLHGDIFVYNNEEDVRAWLARYAMLDRREDTLEAAGESLMHYMHRYHTYKNRAERIIEWVKEQHLMN
jgi:hypothetical protein